MNRCRIVVMSLMFLGAFALAGCDNKVMRSDRREMRTDAYQAAKSLDKDGKQAEAIAKYQSIIDGDPVSALAHLELGILLHDGNIDVPRAIYHYRRYLALRPDADKAVLIADRIKNAEDVMVSRIIDRKKPADSAPKPVNDEKNALLDIIAAKDKEVAELRKNNIELVRKADALQIKYDALSDVTDADRVAQEKPPAVIIKPDETRPVPGGGVNRAEIGPVQTFQKAMRTYVVRREDTLSLIALKMYKDGELWPRIYDANKDAIPDRNRLSVGQVLIIP